MSRRSGFAVFLAGLLLLPGVAHAQRGMRGNRGGPAMTAYGPVFNPALSPEWRQAGGNMDAYQQIMMQKMAAAEQATFRKQLAESQKSLKAQGKVPTPTATTQSPAPRKAVKKKKATLKPSTTASKPVADAPAGIPAASSTTPANATAKAAKDKTSNTNPN